MAQGGTTQTIPLVGTFEQIKAGLGFGADKPASKLEFTVDAIAGRINEISEPQGKRLNRFTTEWANVVQALEDGVQGVPLAEMIIALGATQGFVITLDQLLQASPTPTQTFPVGIPTPGSVPLPGGAVTVDAAGNMILDPRFPTSLATGARGLGFTTPSGFPILPPRRAPSTPGGSTGGFNLFRFIQCLVGSLLPAQPGGTRMPFVTTPGFASSPGPFDFGGLLQSGLNLASSIFSKPQAPATRFPELSRTGFPLPALLGAAGRALLPVGAGFTGGIASGFFGDGGAADLDETAAFTDPLPGRCRPKAHVKINPCTGKGVWFTPRGRPLVFSGDMSACKRVDRVAKRLDKARPKRRHHHHTRSRHPR